MEQNTTEKEKKKIAPRPKPVITEKDTKNETKKKITPRPKPTGTKAVPAVSFAKKMSPRPAPAPVPARNLPPRPPRPNQNGFQNVNNQSQNESFLYQQQAYNNMLSNMQLMNALGLMNGLYQNQMNNNNNNNTRSKSEKDALFEEFYNYLSNKMQKEENTENKEFFNSKESTSDVDVLVNKVAKEVEIGDDVENTKHSAVKKASEKGVSLDEFLQEMCIEDDFIMNGTPTIEVAKAPENRIFSSMNTEISPFVVGDVQSIEEYTQADYENLVNGNFAVFVNMLGEENVEKVGAIVTPNEVEEVESVPEENTEEIDQILNSIEEPQTPKKAKPINKPISNIVEDVSAEEEFEDLYAKDENRKIEAGKLKEIEDALNSILTDIDATETERYNLEVERMKESNTKAKKLLQQNAQTISNKDDALVRFFEMEDEEDVENAPYSNNDEIVIEHVDDEAEKYSKVVYDAMHYDEILEEQKQEKDKEFKKVSEDNNNLKSQVDSLKNIVGAMQSEIDRQENENMSLQQQYNITNTRNKEKDKKLEATNRNIKELEKENVFMKDVVSSLMSEVEELKYKLERSNVNSQNQAKLNKRMKDCDIVAPVGFEFIKEEKVDKKAEKQKDEPIKVAEVEDVVAENVVEEKAKNEEEIAKNLQTVNANMFGEETFNVDGIIVAENSDEISSHFVDKIKMAPADIKAVYNDIRNEIMSYKGVKGRCSSACDTFRLNGETIGKFLLIGRTMKLYLALDPSDSNLPQNIYHQKDESKKKAYKETPFMVRLSSGLSVRKAVKLITYMFEKFDVVKNPKYEYEDFATTLERQVVVNK